ncbi:MAG: DNA topoisomerase IB [Streptosporangiaceae bacterium]|nr:DNA topoisomerase IB [Streptosporangiaceae bacterium]
MPVARQSRLRRSNVTGPGISRIRVGRGFRYLGPDGEPPTAGDLARIKALVIPPAWRDVWICPWPHGHIQAVGVDAAGRKQYLYHARWREKRDKEKHDHVLDFAAKLPDVRKIVLAELDTTVRGRQALRRQRVLAAAVRLLDLGFFRVGGEQYAEEHGTFGLATLRREHVSFARGELTFCYPAKGGYERVQAIADPQVIRVIRSLRSRQDDDDSLLAYWRDGAWQRVHSSDINLYLKELTDLDVSAKDFRTWHATVLAAVGLAVSPVARRSPSSRKRAVARVVREVADYLGNTPAVCRSSYIDPRVIERYDRGDTIAADLDRLGEAAPGSLATHGAVEEAVLRLLRSLPSAPRPRCARPAWGHGGNRRPSGTSTAAALTSARSLPSASLRACLRTRF